MLARMLGKIRTTRVMIPDCGWCGEAIGPNDTRAELASGEHWHYECLIRSIVGSVGHLTGRCSCYADRDKAEEDPPEMTKREAALAAAELWVERRGTQLPS